ncbi:MULTISPECIES: hypothetical protein [Desertifilum]|nr:MULTISPECIES: hypothetical protein [Desertifilum]MDA0209229.1 hypothetical protein [Cyanobacteria bacterium FC1]
MQPWRDASRYSFGAATGEAQWQQQALKQGLIVPLPPSGSDRRS